MIFHPYKWFVIGLLFLPGLLVAQYIPQHHQLAAPYLQHVKRKKTGAMDISLAYIPLHHAHLFGFGFNMEVAIGQRLLSGVEFTIANGTGGDAYQHQINSVQYDYTEVGWINEFRVVDKKRLALNVLVNNFYTNITLNDAGKLVTSGNSSKKHPLELGNSSYYSLQPGLRILFPVFPATSSGPFIKVTYHFLFGQPQFAENRQDFQSFMFSTGFRLDL